MLVFIQYALWFLPAAIQVCLAGLMLRRKLRSDFPVFFSYTIFSVITFVMLFACHYISYAAYFYAYWVTSVVGVGIGFCVIHEIFQHIFRPYNALRDLANVLFRWSALVLVLVALVSVASGGHGLDSRIMQTILVLERSIRVMQCGLVLFLFLFANHVSLSSRSHVFGIAMGFGIFAAIDMTVFTLRSAYGPVGNVGIDMVKSGAYLVACAAWFVNLRLPEPERRVVDHGVRSMDWNLALGTVGQAQQESFLPMIESAVERVLLKRESEFHPQNR